jgi:DNA-3-methyladenine glycosylase II
MTNFPITDPIIQSIAQVNILPEIKKTTNLFVDLVEDIVAQQLSGRVADVIFKRFCSLFPNNKPTPELLRIIPIDELRLVGLSNAKANYVKNIAEYASKKILTVKQFDSLSDEEIIKELTTIKGVGVWTAQMVLIFSLNRPDVFPIDDLAIRLGMQKLYGLELEGKALREKLIEISELWKPNRTLSTRYIWAWVNKQKNNAVRI